jgi:hypothetical protein
MKGLRVREEASDFRGAETVVAVPNPLVLLPHGSLVLRLPLNGL